MCVSIVLCMVVWIFKLIPLAFGLQLEEKRKNQPTKPHGPGPKYHEIGPTCCQIDLYIESTSLRKEPPAQAHLDVGILVGHGHTDHRSQFLFGTTNGSIGSNCMEIKKKQQLTMGFTGQLDRFCLYHS